MSSSLKLLVPDEGWSEESQNLSASPSFHNHARQGPRERNSEALCPIHGLLRQWSDWGMMRLGSLCTVWSGEAATFFAPPRDASVLVIEPLLPLFICQMVGDESWPSGRPQVKAQMSAQGIKARREGLVSEGE